MRLVLYKEQVGGMLVGVTPRPFWYVSWGEPVVVVFCVPVSSSWTVVIRVGVLLFLTDYGQTVGRTGRIGILG